MTEILGLDNKIVSDDNLVIRTTYKKMRKG